MNRWSEVEIEDGRIGRGFRHGPTLSLVPLMVCACYRWADNPGQRAERDSRAGHHPNCTGTGRNRHSIRHPTLG